MHKDLKQEVLIHMAAIHNFLLNKIDPAFHDKVFVEGAPVSLQTQQIDSISSSHSANYADMLLQQFNPQEGSLSDDEHPPKWTRCNLM